MSMNWIPMAKDFSSGGTVLKFNVNEIRQHTNLFKATHFLVSFSGQSNRDPYFRSPTGETLEIGGSNPVKHPNPRYARPLKYPSQLNPVPHPNQRLRWECPLVSYRSTIM
jgi:hypothetical protein